MGGVVALVVFDRTREMGEPRHHAPPVPGYAQRAASLDALLKMTPEQLAGVDIAEMNLPCAAGLPVKIGTLPYYP